jgi:hypothetical protein
LCRDRCGSWSALETDTDLFQSQVVPDQGRFHVVRVVFALEVGPKLLVSVGGVEEQVDIVDGVGVEQGVGCGKLGPA